jgi:hypothetical protein
MFGWKFGRKENDDRIMPVHVRIGVLACEDKERGMHQE